MDRITPFAVPRFVWLPLRPAAAVVVAAAAARTVGGEFQDYIEEAKT